LPEAGDLCREGVRQRRQPPFPGPPGRVAAIGQRQQGAQLRHLGGRLVEDGQQRVDRVQVPHDHDHQRLEEQPVGIGPGAAPPASRRRRQGQSVDHAHQHDKQRHLGYHRHLHGMGGPATTMMWKEASSGQAAAWPFDL